MRATKAGNDADRDHVCPPPRSRADQGAQGRPGQLAAPDAKSRSRSVTRTTSRSPSRTSSFPPSTRADVKHADISEFSIEYVVKKVIPGAMLRSEHEFLINQPGGFVVGGPEGEFGLTRSQDHRRHVWRVGPPWRRGVFGQGPFESRSLGCLHVPLGREECRGLAWPKSAELQVAYAIGYPEPVSIWIDSMGTARCGRCQLRSRIEVFSSSGEIIKQLDLLRPFTGNHHYGHFGKPELRGSRRTAPQTCWPQRGDPAAFRRCSPRSPNLHFDSNVFFHGHRLHAGL